jgi:hypothetical protein
VVKKNVFVFIIYTLNFINFPTLLKDFRMTPQVDLFI